MPHVGKLSRIFIEMIFPVETFACVLVHFIQSFFEYSLKFQFQSNLPPVTSVTCTSLVQFLISSVKIWLDIADIEDISIENWRSVPKSARKNPIPKIRITRAARQVFMMNFTFPYGYLPSILVRASAGINQ